MKRIFALLLAGLLACYPVLAVEVESDDNGFDSELSDVPSAEDSATEDTVSASEDVSLSDVETVPPDDAPAQSDNDTSVTSDADDLDSESSGGDLSGDDSESLSFDSSVPVPVTVVEPDVVYQALPSANNAATVDIVDDPPDNPPFYGCGYITGTTNDGSTVTLYFPINYKDGYFGTDGNGYLFNVNSASISGYYEGVYNNSVSCSGFSYPRYRESSSSGYYDYVNLYLKPTASNMHIATEAAPSVSVTDMLPYVSILLLGVIFLCCMKRS